MRCETFGKLSRMFYILPLLRKLCVNAMVEFSKFLHFDFVFSFSRTRSHESVAPLNAPLSTIA